MKKRLLLLRNKSDEDIEFFERQGFSCQVLPLSEIKLLNLSEQAIEDLNSSQWLIFTSQNPVKMVLSNLTWPIKIACIGQKTAYTVRKYGFEPTFVSSKENKAEMMADWQKSFSDQVQIFYPQSNLAEPLKIGQARIKNIVCYENLEITENFPKLAKLLQNEPPDAVYFASRSAWQRFYKIYKKEPIPIKFIAIGSSTLAAIQSDGHKGSIRPRGRIEDLNQSFPKESYER